MRTRIRVFFACACGHLQQNAKINVNELLWLRISGFFRFLSSAIAFFRACISSRIGIL
jgi:hypothetical protein